MEGGGVGQDALDERDPGPVKLEPQRCAHRSCLESSQSIDFAACRLQTTSSQVEARILYEEQVSRRRTRFSEVS